MSTYRATTTGDGDWWSLVAPDAQGREVAPSRIISTKRMS